MALSNWSTNAAPRVTVTLDPAPPVSTVRAASGAEVKWSREGDRITAESTIGWGDFLVLE